MHIATFSYCALAYQVPFNDINSAHHQNWNKIQLWYNFCFCFYYPSQKSPIITGKSLSQQSNTTLHVQEICKHNCYFIKISIFKISIFCSSSQSSGGYRSMCISCVAVFQYRQYLKLIPMAVQPLLCLLMLNILPQ